ncbi:hypothetical protein SMICM17S_10491 [Streptomyces microflavus]
MAALTGGESSYTEKSALRPPKNSITSGSSKTRCQNSASSSVGDARTVHAGGRRQWAEQVLST